MPTMLAQFRLALTTVKLSDKDLRGTEARVEWAQSTERERVFKVCDQPGRFG